jgi:putative pyruvate formate lyase activating enzyme
VTNGRSNPPPSYLRKDIRPTLAERAEQAKELMSPCHLCPRRCGARRLNGEAGQCRVAETACVSSAGPHFGEEAPLVGTGGSGTIFLSGCNLGCVFCQNWETSRNLDGRPATEHGLATLMLRIQAMGCHNVNLVTPTHVVPQLLAAVGKAVEGGLRLPVVYNTGGYDLVDTLRLLDGVVDIYMPDLKWMRPWVGEALASAPDYPARAKEAIREMHRQVGDLLLDKRGVALRGLLLRHLVLPKGLAGTRAAMKFVASEISKSTYVNVMAQYRPCGDATRHPLLGRSLSTDEYRQALRAASAEGLHRLDKQHRIARNLWRR